MIRSTSSASLAAAIAFAVVALPVGAAAAESKNDYPTTDRVLYVQECMRAHPGPFYEMLNKCSCALDSMAKDLPYDDYVSMNTMVNANSIGGERGGVIRDNEPAQAQIKRYRELKGKVEKGCFISSDAK